MSVHEYYEEEDEGYLLLDYDYVYDVILDAAADGDWETLVAVKDGSHPCMRGHPFATANIDVNQIEDEEFYNPLCLATHFGHLRVVRELLAMSADVDYPSGEGDQTTALITGRDGGLGRGDGQAFVLMVV